MVPEPAVESVEACSRRTPESMFAEVPFKRERGGNLGTTERGDSAHQYSHLTMIIIVLAASWRDPDQYERAKYWPSYVRYFGLNNVQRARLPARVTRFLP